MQKTKDKNNSYSLAQVRKAYTKALEVHNEAANLIRGGVVTPRNSQQAVENVMAFLGEELTDSIVPQIEQNFFRFLKEG